MKRVKENLTDYCALRTEILKQFGEFNSDIAKRRLKLKAESTM